MKKYSIENYKSHIRFLYANQESSKVKKKREREGERESEAKKKKKNVDNFERRSCETRRDWSSRGPMPNLRHG